MEASPQSQSQFNAARIDGGRRKNPLCKRSNTSGPLVTVVTVVYNCADSLEETILSVINQSYNNVEYVIVDGGSTDGTVELLRKYDRHIDYWISEKDSGIYNAMNKGVDLSTGQWINFMNAGDCFHSSTTIANIEKSLDEKFAVVAGGVCYIYDSQNRRIKHMQLKFSGFYLSVPHHQASFINSRWMKHFRYDETFRIRGDLNFMAALYANGHEFRLVDEVICNVDTNGVSSGLSRIHISEDMRAGRLVIEHYGAKSIAYHVLYLFPRLMLRKLLPKAIESKVRSMIN